MSEEQVSKPQIHIAYLSNIYQVSPRRIRNLSLGIYLIHYELIIDKHLQRDRDLLLPQRAHKLNRTKLSPPSGILNMRKKADANQKSLCRSLWRVRSHFLRKLECRMIDDCSGRRRLDERVHSVPGETPSGRDFSLWDVNLFILCLLRRASLLQLYYAKTQIIFILSLLPYRGRNHMVSLSHFSLLLLKVRNTNPRPLLRSKTNL